MTNKEEIIENRDYEKSVDNDWKEIAEIWGMHEERQLGEFNSQRTV